MKDFSLTIIFIVCMYYGFEKDSDVFEKDSDVAFIGAILALFAIII